MAPSEQTNSFLAQSSIMGGLFRDVLQAAQLVAPGASIPTCKHAISVTASAVLAEASKSKAQARFICSKNITSRTERVWQRTHGQ